MPISPRPIPAPSETPEETYRELGLRSGLEIHQQLLTEKKLFCRCPAGPYRKDYDAQILRHLRPTFSEMGRFDPTALMEEKTRKEILYQITGDTTCTYEMDDAPPFRINERAVDIALTIALLLDASIVDRLHIARKQYLDGSIPTGFQRTAVIGLGGRLPYRGREIPIELVTVEEDGCREISDRGHLRVFRTDRLSRPLVEVVTAPAMSTPVETREVARLLSRLCRGTGLVRTGFGAVRQDVNVSVTGGTRTEIKGVPRVPEIGRLAHYEAFRQRALLDLRDRLAERDLTMRSFRMRAEDLAVPDLPPDVAPLAREYGDEVVVRAVLLSELRESLPWPIGPTRTFADEIADRARVVACLDGEPNALFEHDGRADPAFWAGIRSRLEAGPEDGLMCVWGPPEDVEVALDEIEDRCRFAFGGVPGESRQARPGGETRFERVLPGADRMYPDTDLPPFVITDERFQRVRASLPDPAWVVEDRLIEAGVPAHEASTLAVSARGPLARRAIAEHGLRPADAGRFLASTMRALRRAGVPVKEVPDETLLDLLDAYARGTFPRESFADLLAAVAVGVPVVEVLAAARGRAATAGEIGKAVRAAAASAPAIPDAERASRHLMGIAMGRLRGRASGTRVRAELDRVLGEADG